MSKHKHLPESDIYRNKVLSKKNVNKTFNTIEIILITSIFNALFYRYGLDVYPAFDAFLILFGLVFVVYVVYKVKNKRKKKKRRWKKLMEEKGKPKRNGSGGGQRLNQGRGSCSETQPKGRGRNRQ